MARLRTLFILLHKRLTSMSVTWYLLGICQLAVEVTDMLVSLLKQDEQLSIWLKCPG